MACYIYVYFTIKLKFLTNEKADFLFPFILLINKITYVVNALYVHSLVHQLVLMPHKKGYKMSIKFCPVETTYPIKKLEIIVGSILHALSHWPKCQQDSDIHHRNVSRQKYLKISDRYKVEHELVYLPSTF